MNEISIPEAAAFAAQAHASTGEKRRYTGEPYIVHPAAVVALLKEHGHQDPVLLASAWLHDVVEGTEVELSEIRAAFGAEVAEYVGLLTDDPLEVGPRRVRKARTVARLGAAPAPVQTIKLADLIDNTKTIVQHDPGFARIYLGEKEELLGALRQGDARLQEEAWELLAQGQRALATPVRDPRGASGDPGEGSLMQGGGLG